MVRWHYIPCARLLTEVCSIRAAGLFHHRNEPDRFDYLRTKYAIEFEYVPPSY